MLYRLHFSAAPDDPFPSLDTLPMIEAADSPSEQELVNAVQAFLATGKGPQTPGYKWARVILNTHPNGKPWQVIRVQISGEVVAPVDWNSPSR